MKITIGSTAMKFWYPDFNREPGDLDYAISYESEKVTGNKKVEYLYNPVLFKYTDEGQEYLTPDQLYTLKVSHLTYDTNWRKHMYDANFLARKGCRLNLDLLEDLRVFWKEYLPKVKRSNLEMSKEDFFNNAVNPDENHHDSLHLLINPIPMYTRVLKDGAEVELDENKFHNLSHEDKLSFILEETGVMAWERFRHLPWYHAYSIMLEKFIKQHIPLFALPFAVENYHTLAKPTINFIKIINDGLRESEEVLV